MLAAVQGVNGATVLTTFTDRKPPYRT